MKIGSKGNLRKLDFLSIACIILIGLILRLYPFRANAPIADLYSRQQADTAAVGRNFVEGGFDLLHPRSDNLAPVSSNHLDNPQGYRMAEFPIYSAIFAAGFRYLPLLSLEDWGRAVSIFFSLTIITTLYYFLYKEHGRKAAIAGSLIYAIFPFFVFFSRAILPDTTALGFAFISLFFLYLFADSTSHAKKIIFFCLSVCLLALAGLTKPHIALYSIGSFYLFARTYGWGFLKKFQFYIYFLLAFSPLIAWQIYMQGYPEGIPASKWLMTSGVNTATDIKNTFFTPLFFQQVFYSNINNLIFGGYLSVFFVVGILTKIKKHFLYSLFAGATAYLLIFQTGNMEHVYYQILILPVLAIFVGIGISTIISESKLLISPLFCWIIVITLSIFSFYISYLQVRGFYSYSTDLVKIANIVTDLTTSSDKIVTDSNGDTTLLYLAGRRGAPSFYTSFDSLRQRGYTYFVTFRKNISEDELDKNRLDVVFQNDKFTLIKINI